MTVLACPSHVSYLCAAKSSAPSAAPPPHCCWIGFLLRTRCRHRPCSLQVARASVVAVLAATFVAALRSLDVRLDTQNSPWGNATSAKVELHASQVLLLMLTIYCWSHVGGMRSTIYISPKEKSKCVWKIYKISQCKYFP